MTDNIQPIDAGIGKDVKDEMGHALDEKMQDDDFFKDWCDGLPAWRKRVLMTRLLAAAWTKVCEKWDFRKLGQKLGLPLALDKKDDDLIHLQGTDGPYNFSKEEAELGPDKGSDVEDGDDAEDSDDDDDDDEAVIEDSSDEEADDTDEKDEHARANLLAALAPAGYELVSACPPMGEKIELNEIIGKTILYLWDGAPVAADRFGYYRGKIARLATSKSDLDAGYNFIVKFSNSETNSTIPYSHGQRSAKATALIPCALLTGEYGEKGKWILINKI